VIRVVLDTNVLVSALLVPASPPARVLRQFRDGRWNMVVSGSILEEYARFLRRKKFGLPVALVDDTLHEIERRSISVIPSRHFDAVPHDPSDNEFLDVAVEAGAECIVSGDQHLLDIKRFENIPIYAPAGFLTRFF